MKQKPILLLASIILVSSVLHSQTPPNEKYKCYAIELNKEDTRIKIPYQTIIITDERPDTLKAGYYYPGEKDRGKRKVCFQNGMKNQISSFIIPFFEFDANSKISILACIKKLWFGTYDTTNIKENKLPFRTRKLLLKIEFYLKNQSCYFPLYRFDSTINMNYMPEKQPSFALATALKASMRKLQATYPENYSNCLLKQQVDSFNNISGSFPILNEEIAKKGVYMTPTQFRNNEPAYTKFNLKFYSNMDAVSIPGKEKDSTVKAWAVSDGVKMYIRMGENYFPLFKSGNNYDFYGFDTFFYTPTPNPNTTPVGVMVIDLITAKRTRSKPFQVDLETGDIY